MNPNNLPLDVIKNSTDVVCECGCPYYDQAVVVKRLSAIISPSGKTEIVPVGIFVCRACSTPLNME